MNALPRRAGRRRSPWLAALQRERASGRRWTLRVAGAGVTRADRPRWPLDPAPPRHAVRRPRLSHGRRRRAGSGSGPCARCPDDAARPPSASPGPGPVAWGAGGGPRARLWALRAPLPLRPGARRRLPRQLLRPRTADARARAAHPRGCHRAVSNPPPRNADRTVAMVPGGRGDIVGKWGPSGEQAGGEASARLHPLGRGWPGRPPAWRASQGVGASPASTRGNGVRARPFPGRGSSVVRSAQLNKENLGPWPAVSPPGVSQSETE